MSGMTGLGFRRTWCRGFGEFCSGVVDVDLVDYH